MATMVQENPQPDESSSSQITGKRKRDDSHDHVDLSTQTSHVETELFRDLALDLLVLLRA